MTSLDTRHDDVAYAMTGRVAHESYLSIPL
jgi:hypothetical protein